VLRPTLTVIVGVGLAWGMVPSGAVGQSRDERVQSLVEDAVPVRTIDPLDDDFNDLEFLREILGSARVVLLGEQTHGDGATFLAKARLIAFLHREMEFDVLAFESGFYECEVAEERLREGEDAHTAIRRCVFGIWTESAEFQPTIDLIQASRGGDRPLRITGFDSQMTGSASRDFLMDDLRRVAADARASFEWEVHGEMLRNVVEDDFLAGAVPRPAEETRRAFQDAMLEFGREVEGSATENRAYWSQVIRSVAEHARGVWEMDDGQTSVASTNIRDRQMAENLLWHLDHTLAGRKVIVWAATLHNARNLHLVESEWPGATDLYGEVRVMGSHLEEALGQDLYSIGFIALEGAMGFPWTPPSPLLSGGPEALEAMLADAGFELAFVDLRTLSPSTEWLRLPVTSGPLGYVPMSAPWGRVLDGFVFTREMTPSRPRVQ
jgi:erythromycin esterase